MALVLFAITLFVSAFILFLVQPMIGKMILPKLGGTPQVWNTCMVFFQMVLLLGYFYTHAVSSRLPVRRQLIVHGLLLLAPFAILLPTPFYVENWVPTLGANPLISTLVLLFAVVGIPFFVVSTSAPLLQRWFGFTGHPAAKDPYFLYGASNLGSLLALLLYPFAIEPWLDLRPQALFWTGGYIALVVTVYACIAMVWSSSATAVVKREPAPVTEGPSAAEHAAPTPETATGVTATAPSTRPTSPIKKGAPPRKPHGPGEAAPDIALGRDEMTTWRRLRWIGLAAVPVSLMLGVTTHITTDLSPIPLFWLIPLTLYLLSFILVFSKWPIPWVDQPHTAMLYIQPALICLMLLAEFFGGSTDPRAMWFVIGLNVLAFFATALVCHGELAKDRPSTQHLTEFYLLMSFGGMLGGMFNGIVAPIIFIHVWEFSVAVICACILRPIMKESGWADELIGSFLNKPTAVPAQRHGKGAHAPKPAVAHAADEAPLTPLLDYVLPAAVGILCFMMVLLINPTPHSQELIFVFGLPLVVAAFYYGRPIRFGLAITAIILVNGFVQNKYDRSLYADRSYFGIIRVSMSTDATHKQIAFMQLTHGHINHGMNIFRPDDSKEWGDPTKDYSRLATTYYHRFCPVGVAMEKFNWFPGEQNTYHADARLPSSLICLGGSSLGTSILPVEQLAALWSEPAFATIGLGTGTMASYGRPYQHVHYYEIDNHIRRLNLPLKKDQYYFSHLDTPFSPGLPDEQPFVRSTYETKARGRTYFTYLKDAIRRGSELHVYMGDARLRMALPYRNFHDDPNSKVPPGGPERFYHLIVVDAFSSDAIPVHLLTEEAFKMYFDHMHEQGVLCVHTSNRFVRLPLVVAAVADKLGYSWRRGHTVGASDFTQYDNTSTGKNEARDIKNLGRYSSEWVMVARKAEYLKHLEKWVPYNAGQRFWNTTTANPRYLWTDDHSNLMDVLGKKDED